MEFDKKAAESEVRELIRSGKKTSEIIASTRYPVEFIKGIKSEELVNDKKIDRANLDEQQERANEARRIRQDEAFMKKYNLNKPENAGDATVSAPALGAGAQL